MQIDGQKCLEVTILVAQTIIHRDGEIKEDVVQESNLDG